MTAMAPPPGGATIRMYRHGLGDCFLLGFDVRGASPYYVLIDCGVVLGTPDPGARMTEVVKSIAETTGQRIHLLVVTHEHWDHLSGFLQAAEEFRGFQVDNLWFAWTENPADDLANSLRHEFGRDVAALRVALGRSGHSEALVGAQQLTEFFGAVSGGKTTSDALAAVRALPKSSAPVYLYPGDGPLPLPAAVGLNSKSDPAQVRVYVLGPPHDEAVLKRVNPTAKGKEVYTEVGLTPRSAFLLALRDPRDLAPDEAVLRELSFPFDARVRVPLQQAASLPFFMDHYGPPAPAPTVALPPDEGTWRRIDDDWLGTSGALALQLDSYTNNTSLVLAFEFPDSGRVLLFAADAQVGNWLSWGDLTWQVNQGATRSTVTSKDLLNRAVLYKVGHHGSHNGTVRGQGDTPLGLELMMSKDLVAFISVDHAMAVKKRWGKMPFDRLVQRLSEKTSGRVVQSDRAVSTPPLDGLRNGPNDLFYEYDVR